MPLVHFSGDRVTVDDDTPVVALVIEKRPADPSQVFDRLLGERDARPDAGVDEQIFSERCRVGKSGEERQMLLRYGASKKPECAIVLPSIPMSA